MADRIVRFARRRRGTRVGDGGRFTMVDRPLRGADARSASHYRLVTPDADYLWGTSIALADLRPGTVIQFRDYQYEQVVVTENADGTTTEGTTHERPHQTAIVEGVEDDGVLTVLEQNSPRRSLVRCTQLFFTSGTVKSGNTKTAITVSGTSWFYRPEPRRFRDGIHAPRGHVGTITLLRPTR